MSSRIISILLCLVSLLPAYRASAQESETYPRLTNLPTVYIETLDNQPIVEKEVYIPATLRYVDETGSVKVYDALEIRGRGNSTWGLEKKPYRIKFTKKQEFLGPDHAKAKSWTLLANHTDKTLMRNAVASCIGRFAGQPFSPAAKFVDLVLNGEYLGNYQISDQVEIRPKRIEITEQPEEVDETTDITGGYFLEVDGFAAQEPVYFTTRQGVKITIKSPDDDVITPAQIKYISDYIQRFEDALFSADMADPEKGYRPYVDAETLASWYVASEYTGNPDAFWSINIYKERGDDKIYWGPLWDFDIAFNNSQRQGNNERSLMVDVGFGSAVGRIWVRQLWKDPWFVTLACNKWKEMADAGICDHVLEFIDTMAESLNESQKLNFQKWSISKRVYDEYKLFSTYDSYVDFLRNFVRTRTTYLTEAFEAARPPEPFEADTTTYYGIENVGASMLLDVNTNGEGCIWSLTQGRHSQHWRVLPAAANGTFIIINRATGLAVTEKSTPVSGGVFATSVPLGFSTPDPTDPMQQWTLQPLEANIYAVYNNTSGLGWNNRGAGTANGNQVISWTSNEDNASKPTRQWRFNPIEPLASVSDVKSETDYTVTYSPSTRTLRFITPDGSVSGYLTVYTAQGAEVFRSALDETVTLPALPAGTYILSWNVASSAPQSCKILLN